MEVKIVGEIKFKTCTLPVYRDLDEPLFKAGDVAELTDYGPNNIWNLTNLCEEDERLVLSSEVAGQHRRVTFSTTSLPRVGSRLPGRGGGSLPRS